MFPLVRLFHLMAAFIILASGIGIVISSMHMMQVTWSPAPYADHWAAIVTGRSDVWGWILRQHNEHRIVVSKLVFILDRLLDREQGRVDLIVSTGLQVGLALLLTVLAARGRTRAHIATAFGISLACAFWAVQWENFTWTFQVHFFAVTAGAVALFAATARQRTPMVLIVILMAVEAMTLSSGILACYVAVPLALYVRRPRWHSLVLLCAAVGITALYLHGYGRLPSTVSPLAIAGTPLPFLRFFAAVVGSPIGQGAAILLGVDALSVSIVAGLLGILAAVVFLLGLAAARRDPRGAALGATLAFLLAVAAATAYGRVGLGVDVALTSRYTSPMSIFWACIALAVLVAFDGLRLRDTLLRLVMPIGLIVLILGSQRTFVDAAVSAADLRQQGLPPLISNVADDQAIVRTFPRPEEVWPQVKTLRAAQTSLFAAPWSRWSGLLLRSLVTIDPTACRGDLSLSAHVYDSERPGWHVEGDVSSNVERIVMAGADGRVSGYGLPQIGGDDLRHWTGVFTGDASGTTAYGIVGSAACPMLISAHVAPTPSVDMAATPPGLGKAGGLEQVVLGAHGRLIGWAPMVAGRLHIDTNLPLRVISSASVIRHDVATAYQKAELAESGFRIDIAIDPGVAMPEHSRLCVWSEGPRYGRAEMMDLTKTGLCP